METGETVGEHNNNNDEDHTGNENFTQPSSPVFTAMDSGGIEDYDDVNSQSDKNDKIYLLNFMLTNARSLAPKSDSLI